MEKQIKTTEVKEIRQALALTQGELATHLMVTPSTISLWESDNGGRKIHPKFQKELRELKKQIPDF